MAPAFVAAPPCAGARGANLGRAFDVVARPIVADAIKFESRPQSAAEHYLGDCLLRAVFADPVWAHRPPPVPFFRRAQIQGQRVEVIALLAKWNRVGALALMDAGNSDETYRCRLRTPCLSTRS